MKWRGEMEVRRRKRIFLFKKKINIINVKSVRTDCFLPSCQVAEALALRDPELSGERGEEDFNFLFLFIR